MLTRVLKLATAAALAVLLFAPESGAWGVARVGVARPLPAPVVRGGRTVAWGPGGAWVAGRPGWGPRVYRSGYFGVGPGWGPVRRTAWVRDPWGGFRYSYIW
jgi:hypothetical protein